MTLIIEHIKNTKSEYPGYGDITDHLDYSTNQYQFFYVTNEGDVLRSFMLEYRDNSNEFMDLLKNNTDVLTKKVTTYFGDEQPTDLWYFKTNTKPSVKDKPSLSDLNNKAQKE